MLCFVPLNFISFSFSDKYIYTTKLKKNQDNVPIYKINHRYCPNFRQNLRLPTETQKTKETQETRLPRTFLKYLFNLKYNKRISSIGHGKPIHSQSKYAGRSQSFRLTYRAIRLVFIGQSVSDQPTTFQRLVKQNIVLIS